MSARWTASGYRNSLHSLAQVVVMLSDTSSLQPSFTADIFLSPTEVIRLCMFCSYFEPSGHFTITSVTIYTVSVWGRCGLPSGGFPERKYKKFCDDKSTNPHWSDFRLFKPTSVLLYRTFTFRPSHSRYNEPGGNLILLSATHTIYPKNPWHCLWLGLWVDLLELRADTYELNLFSQILNFNWKKRLRNREELNLNVDWQTLVAFAVRQWLFEF